eukprot:gb/GFBE01008770.1/.p1 GENE.gb/GFBE01008770.1/~~gb/GFBE01008770.1/.p1  ORF type:complete len:616 (+),score=125.67 gb/GFBE01008770.1/:1-1848(+)
MALFRMQRSASEPALWKLNGVSKEARDKSSHGLDAQVRLHLRETTQELEHVRQQVADLRAEAAAKDVRHAELLRVVEHVDEQVAARRKAEEQLKLAQAGAEAEAAEKDRRYSELFHMVCQVDREVAARKEAEKRLETTSTSARQAVARASEQLMAAESRAKEAREHAEVAEESRVTAELRASEMEAQLAPLRHQLSKATMVANERKDLNSSLQEQLASVVQTSEARASAAAEAAGRLASYQAQLAAAHQEIEMLTTVRIAALEKERDAAREQLQQLEQEHEALQQAHQETGGILCERYGEANLNREIVDGLKAEITNLRSGLADLEAQLAAKEAESNGWRDRAMLAAQELVEGQSKAVSAFLHKFPVAAALVTLFKHLLVQVAGSPEAAIRERLRLHGALGQMVSRHEMDQFLADDIGLRGADLPLVAQALFGALDLEREGQISQELLLLRLEQPPSMKAVWLADLENLWPGREPIVQFARTSPPRAQRPASVRPASTRPMSARPMSARPESAQKPEGDGSRPGSASKTMVGLVRSCRPASATGSPQWRITSSPGGVLSKAPRTARRPPSACSYRGTAGNQEGFPRSPWRPNCGRPQSALTEDQVQKQGTPKRMC